MPISIDTLRSAASRSTIAKSVGILNEARSLGLRTAFQCHSHEDADQVEGLLTLFAEGNWRVHVDWRDAEMPEKPTRETAERIQS